MHGRLGPGDVDGGYVARPGLAAGVAILSLASTVPSLVSVIPHLVAHLRRGNQNGRALIPVEELDREGRD